MTGAVTTEYGGVVVHSAGHHGAFPYCNSLVVRGTEATLVIDPSLAFVAGAPPADLVLVSHAHEDHVAGLAGYDSRDEARGGSGSRGAGEVQVLAHESDRAAAGSRVLMAEGQGLPADGLAEAVVRLGEKFHTPSAVRSPASPTAMSSTSAGVPSGWCISRGTPRATAASWSSRTASSTSPTST